jgi:hypothetical protein
LEASRLAEEKKAGVIREQCLRQKWKKFDLAEEKRIAAINTNRWEKESKTRALEQKHLAEEGRNRSRCGNHDTVKS